MAIQASPAKAANDDGHQHVDERRQVEGEADPGGSEAAHEELALDADVEQAAAQRDAGGNAADQDRRRLQQRAGNALRAAEGAAQQRRQDTVMGFSSTASTIDRAQHQRQQDRQCLTGKGREPVAHQATSAMRSGLVAASACHHETDLLFADAIAGEVAHDAPGEHHEDAVGQRDQFVELHGDQQDRATFGALAHDLVMDRLGGADVDAACRLIDQQEARIAGKFARQHDLLDIAARKALDGLVRSLRANVEALDQRLASAA